jgi:hypothetical protein
MTVGVPFSDFVDGEELQQGDTVVGLRNGLDTKFDFPGDGFKDASGNYLLKYLSSGPDNINSLQIRNSPTGVPVSLIPTGSDTHSGILISSRNDGNVYIVSPSSGHIFISNIGNGNTTIDVLGMGNFKVNTNTGYLIVNNTDPYNAVSDDITLSADSDVTLPTQHAVKTYVDGHISSTTFFIATLVATTTNLSATYDNGTSGVGATLTAISNGAAVIDDIVLSLGDIVLFKDQSAAFQNGVYSLIQVGDGSNPAIYERYIYFDDVAEIKQGYVTFTIEGTQNARKGYQLISVVVDIGVDDIDYQQITIPTLSSSVDNTIVRFDGTSGGQIQDTGITIDDSDVLSGATQINVDNLRLDGNTLSSTDVNGDITIEPNGTGKINLDSNEVYISQALIHAGDSNNNITFGSDTQDFQTGGSSRLDISDTGVRLGATDARITSISDDTTLAADSSTLGVTQHAVKTYVDSQTGDVSDSTFITNTDETATLPNSDPLSAKATGILASTTTTGALTTRVLTGTSNQINIANGDGASDPTFTLSATIVTPGTLTLGGTFFVTGQNIEATSGNVTIITDNSSAIDLSSPTVLIEQDLVHAGDPDNKITFGTDTQNFQTGGASRMDISDTGVRLGGSDARITAISDDTTMAADSSTLGVTQHAVKTYVDSSTPSLNQTFITNTDETGSLPNSDPLSAKATGILASTTSTGALTTRVLTGTANQVAVSNGDGSGTPTFSLPSTLIAPGTFQATTSINIGGAGATVTSISTDGTLASNSDTLLSTQKAIKAYVDATVVPLQFATAALVATSNITLSGIQTVDGVATTTQVVLAQNQTSAVDNGLYTANTLGAWTRTVGYTTWANFYRLIVSVTGGLTHAGTSWQCTVGDSGTVGVDALPFVAAAFQTYTAGTGLTLSDNAFSLTAPVTIALGGTNTTSAIGASGTIAQSDGTKYTFTTATYPTTAGTAGTILRSNATNWINSTSTFADTYSVSTILYASSANTVTGLATANSAVLRTNSTGVPAWSSSMTDGQLLIGSTGAIPATAALTQGTGITITNGAGSITIAASGGGSLPTVTNSATLVSTAAGAAVWTSTMTNGQLVIGNTSGTPTAATLTQGTGMTITNGAGTITVALSTPVSIANGGTNTTSAIGATGTLAQSDGTKYTWTTATYPSTAGTAGKIHISDGTNIVASTPTYPNSATGTGKILRADGTNWVASTATYPDTATGTGTFLRADGTNWVASTATIPGTAGTSGTLLQSNGTNWVNTTATYPGTAGTSGTLLSSNGTNIVNTTATYPVTSGTSGTVLRSNGTNIVNSTSTFADTYSASTILYSNGANTVTGLVTANSAALVTNSSGVPAWSSTMTNGQLIIGSTSATPTAATLTAGTGVTVTNGAGTITIAATSVPATSEVTGTSQSMAVNTTYIANNASLVTLTLPTTAALGEFVQVLGKGAGLFKIAQNASQVIRFVSSSTTTGTGGSLTAIERYDSITLKCITANTDWIVVDNTGTYTIV